MLFCFNFIWNGCFKKMHHLLFMVRANDVNSPKSQPKISICWINKMTSDKQWQAKFSDIVSQWKQFLSFKNCRSVRICSVLNRSNRDTTVYYRLIFCAFSWPNMVKWRNSGIIILITLVPLPEMTQSLLVYDVIIGYQTRWYCMARQVTLSVYWWLAQTLKDNNNYCRLAFAIIFMATSPPQALI